ncbi:hypothetical protein E4U43_007269 [Claviceps pusilla]|uniref:Velvet domain-containing protein n=1 Tax=Claviceps pusilla TaxID=123648 RepID=A0A9P7NIT6_9HYPO|nr:hypothetical protein E4U43_007269 [Claviceps pusilla]
MAETKVFVQPPRRVQVGASLHPPIVVVMSSPAGTYRGNLFADAHVHHNENAESFRDALNGGKTANGFVGQAQTAQKDVCLFSWPDLAFAVSGSFSLRIDVFEANGAGATIIGSVRTREIIVTEEPVLGKAVLPEERQALQIAKDWGSLPQAFRI